MEFVNQILCPFTKFYSSKSYICTKHEYKLIKQHLPFYIKLKSISSGIELQNLQLTNVVYIKYSSGSGGDVLDDNEIYKECCRLFQGNFELLYITPNESNYNFYKSKGKNVYYSKYLCFNTLQNFTFIFIILPFILIYSNELLMNPWTGIETEKYPNIFMDPYKHVFMDHFTKNAHFSIFGNHMEKYKYFGIRLNGNSLNYTLENEIMDLKSCYRGYCQKMNFKMAPINIKTSLNGVSNHNLTFYPQESKDNSSILPVTFISTQITSYSKICLNNPSKKLRNEIMISIEGSGLAISKFSSNMPKILFNGKNISLFYNPFHCDQTSLFKVCSKIWFKVDERELNPYQLYNFTIRNSLDLKHLKHHYLSFPSFSNIDNLNENICSKPIQNSWVNLTGSGFHNHTIISLMKGGIYFHSVVTKFISKELLSIQIPLDLVFGTYSLISRNFDCEYVSNATITINPNPRILYIDKRVIYSGLMNEIMIYTSGLTLIPKYIDISNGKMTQKVDFIVENSDINKIILSIPSGIEDGEWMIYINGCELISLESAFISISKPSITHDISLINSVFPQNESNEIRVLGSQFEHHLQLYLFEKNETPIQLDISRVLNDSITAILPQNLKGTIYHLVLFSQEGSFGILKNAIKISSNLPPKISEIHPNIFQLHGGTAIISGINFDNVSISLDCKDEIKTPIINSWSSNTINITLYPVISASVCVVFVKNSDGLFVKFSNIIYQNSTDIQSETQSRSQCSLSYQSSWNSKYLYSIQEKKGLLNSIEMVNMDEFGNIGKDSLILKIPYTIQKNSECKINGSNIYLTESKMIDEDQIIRTTFRAKILDSQATPRLKASLIYDPLNNTSLKSGTYYYRLSAVYDLNEETLPGNIIQIYIPEIGSYKINLTWNDIPKANGYNIYESTNGVSFYYLTHQHEKSFIYQGGIMGNLGKYPLPKGSLGFWVSSEQHDHLEWKSFHQS